jgi:hypothetical protein
MIDLYIYYQVGAGEVASLLPRVLAMQSRLAAEYGVAPQLKRRPQADGAGRQTWMEVYPAAADDFAGQVDAAAREARLSEAASSPRHSEVFIDLTMGPMPCA